MKDATLIALIATFALCGIVLAQENVNSSAKIFIDETSFDFGYIPGGEIVSHTYWLYSRGTDSLKIFKVQPGCGCTKAPLRKDVVAAGDSTDVELIYTSSKGGRGLVAKSATVTCNDNDRKSLALTFKGKTYDHPDSLTPLTLSDAVIRINPDTKSKEVKLVVRNVSKTGVRMSLVSLPSDYLKVDLPNSEIKPGKEKEIKVRLSPSVSGEDFKKSFTFAVNDSAGTRYTVPVVFARAAVANAIAPSSNK